MCSHMRTHISPAKCSNLYSQAFAQQFSAELLTGQLPLQLRAHWTPNWRAGQFACQCAPRIRTRIDGGLMRGLMRASFECIISPPTGILPTYPAQEPSFSVPLPEAAALAERPDSCLDGLSYESPHSKGRVRLAWPGASARSATWSWLPPSRSVEFVEMSRSREPSVQFRTKAPEGARPRPHRPRSASYCAGHAFTILSAAHTPDRPGQIPPGSGASLGPRSPIR